MKSTRIEFPKDDPARFNALRDQWRKVASGWDLPKAGLRVAAVLPDRVNRDYGYAFPTDRQIAIDIEKDEKTAKRGLAALAKAGLIERVIRPKFGEGGKISGKTRRIFLCLPTEGTFSQKPKGQNDDKPKGHLPKGHNEPKGQNRETEGTYGCPYIPDSNTPDKEIRSEEEVHVYVPAREGLPPIYGNDLPFLEAFDRAIIELTDNKDIAAGELEHLLEQSFYSATKSDADNPPIYWSDICALRQPETQTWFRRRAGQLIYRKKAA